MQAAATTGGSSLFIVEMGLTLIAVLGALCWPHVGSQGFLAAESRLIRLARRKYMAVFAVGCGALLMRLAILPVIPIPQPFIHDEFSFLLASDTFASGRLANHTHPMWLHFESFHITQKPSYMSMYFAAQGLLLAAGQVIAGNPWYGIWFGAGLMCAAICWALRGWLPPGWALLGGALAVVRLGVFSYWTNSYYGGTIAAIGGALVIGALPRILRRYRIRDGLLMAAGAIILANSRPYEGLLVCAPAAIMAARSILRQTAGVSMPAPLTVASPLIRSIFRMTLAPAALLLAAAGLMGYYNYRVFGDPLTLPYQVNRAAYASAPVFVWQAARPAPAYRHAVMRDFYTRWEMDDYREARTLRGFLNRTAQKTGTVLFFVFGVVLLPPLFMLHRVLRDRRVRYIICAAGIFGAGLATNVWLFPHYVAPFAAGFYVILLQALRHLRCWRPGRHPVGVAMVRMLTVTCLVLAGLRIGARPLNLTTPRWPSMWYGTEPLGLPRAAVATKLAGVPGRQLAIVRYAPWHTPFDDWVYNAADIDRSQVVWARDMGKQDNVALLEYFRERSVWLVEPDAVPPRVTRWR